MPDIRPLESRLQRIIDTFAFGSIGGVVGMVAAVTWWRLFCGAWWLPLWVLPLIPLAGVGTAFLRDASARRTERKLLPIARVLR
jgi:hypothetical protein